MAGFMKAFACTVVLFACGSFVPAFAGYTLYGDLPYVTDADSKQQTLDVYVPRNDASVPMPVHIFVHGGGWVIGDKGHRARRRAAFYTDRGVVLVSINYRLSPDYTHPAHVEDCAAAVKWVVDNISQYGGDPAHIVLSGHSAGAHLVALLAIHPDYLFAQGLSRDLFKAVVPVDTGQFDLTQPLAGHGANMLERMKEKAFGTSIEILTDASPALQVTPNASLSPFRLFVTADRSEAAERTRQFAEVLERNGHDAHYVVIDGGYSHGDMNRAIYENDSPVSQTILDFLFSD